MKKYRSLFESIDINFIKKNIQKAIKENPKRLGHGDTRKTGFWILSNGTILPYTKGYKEAYNSGNVISVHSHSSASGSTKGGFDTFSGGDIPVLQHMLKYGYGDTLIVISADGFMDILQGGNWKKEDGRFDIDREIEDSRILLKDLAKKRGAKYLTLRRWK